MNAETGLRRRLACFWRTRHDGTGHRAPTLKPYDEVYGSWKQFEEELYTIYTFPAYQKAKPSAPESLVIKWLVSREPDSMAAGNGC